MMTDKDILQKLRVALRLLVVAVLLNACSRPECHNTNPVFDQNSPYSKVYKDELIAQLKTVSKEDVRYWIDTYEGRNGEVFLHLFVQGGDLCAKAVLTIPPERDEKLHQKKGNWKHGYGSRGAEVIGLKYDMVQTSETTELIFQGWDGMID
jgi:hypothetical protein